MINDHTIFNDVSDALRLRNPSIPEKDYFVVQLLKILNGIQPVSHSFVFSGGTSLTKYNIKLNRMSEDVDIKIIPSKATNQLSKTQAGKVRLALRDQVIAQLNQSSCFNVSMDNPKNYYSRDQYRYTEIQVGYPQKFSQAPCLRPYIKLELMETALIGNTENISICSLHNQVANFDPEIAAFPTTCLITTQAEKLISMLRRTSSLHRSPDQRADDEALVRHVYDTYHLQEAAKHDSKELAHLVATIIKLDVERYGNQHQEFVDDPIAELQFGLTLLETNPIHKDRYTRFVTPMVYQHALTWEDALAVFKALFLSVVDVIETERLLD
ncbi:nucleotidyl transferase AbiEii/AbiGii toxin family protein [Photobacterium leiognathi]|uniref:nucleotidyl transferase AbiEii/AbiGii toxin family protein n=1 Tax=Photobacterium leiognathi TaxID=553611 RepID=UPI0029824EFC|nr:nucleotidyl transferase AbiEii/AbiGii toxin family protein [Photobacterium leiognathi]